MSGIEKRKARNWTKEETVLFVEILIDEEFNFADCLERRALKRSANEEVYQEILKIFNCQLNEEKFIQRNKKNFGKNIYESLKLDTKKLQMKYNALKKKWREIKANVEKGSGVSPEKLPMWYSLLDRVLSDTNAKLEDAICSNPNNASYIQGNYPVHDVVAGDKSNLFDEEEDMDEEPNTIPVSGSTPKNVVKPHRKRKVVFSQTQALLQLAGSLNQLVESHAKQHKEQMNFERERDKTFFDFKKQEAEKNRQHEIEIAKIFAGALGSMRSLPQDMSHFYSQQPDQNPDVNQYYQRVMSSPSSRRSLDPEHILNNPASPTFPQD